MIGVCMRWLGGRIHPPRDEIVKRGSLTRVVIDPKYWHAPCILRAATEPCGFLTNDDRNIKTYINDDDE